jgi:hypothetical protein
LHLLWLARHADVMPYAESSHARLINLLLTCLCSGTMGEDILFNYRGCFCFNASQCWTQNGTMYQLTTNVSLVFRTSLCPEANAAGICSTLLRAVVNVRVMITLCILLCCPLC